MNSSTVRPPIRLAVQVRQSGETPDLTLEWIEQKLDRAADRVLPVNGEPVWHMWTLYEGARERKHNVYIWINQEGFNAMVVVEGTTEWQTQEFLHKVLHRLRMQPLPVLLDLQPAVDSIPQEVA